MGSEVLKVQTHDMNEKQILVALIGGVASAFLAILLISTILWLAHANDGGDDGLAMITIALTIVSGICGFIFTAKWARKRNPDFRP